MIKLQNHFDITFIHLLIESRKETAEEKLPFNDMNDMVCC